MPYKPGLYKALEADYESEARRYLEEREKDASEAMCALGRMKVIARNMEHAQRMIDCTVGKEPLAADHRCATL